MLFVALFLTFNGSLNPAFNYGRNENIRRAVRGLIGCPPWPEILHIRVAKFRATYIAYNDFLSGPLIDRANFKNLFGMIYFDLRNQEEDVKDSVVSLTFRYELNGGNATNYTLNALVLHEKEIELYTASGKLLVKA